jgi:hypothetical protein
MTDSKKTNGDAKPGDRPKKGTCKHRSDLEDSRPRPGRRGAMKAVNRP